MPEQKEQSLAVKMAAKYEMKHEAFLDTIRNTIMPSGSTPEHLVAFLIVANEYDLNPFIKQIYAFKSSAGGIHPIVPIDGWTKIVNSSPQFNGMEFRDTLDKEDNIASITCTIYRKDRDKPTVITEYLAECRRDTSPWKQWPIRMLRHKAFIQCARYAFGLAGIYDPDEAQRIDIAEQAATVEGKSKSKVTELEDRLRDAKDAEFTPVVEPEPEPEKEPGSIVYEEGGEDDDDPEAEINRLFGTPAEKKEPVHEEKRDTKKIDGVRKNIKKKAAKKPAVEERTGTLEETEGDADERVKLQWQINEVGELLMNYLKLESVDDVLKKADLGTTQEKLKKSDVSTLKQVLKTLEPIAVMKNLM